MKDNERRAISVGLAKVPTHLTWFEDSIVEASQAVERDDPANAGKAIVAARSYLKGLDDDLKAALDAAIEAAMGELRDDR